MWSNIIASVVNVVGNAIAIFGPFGLPKTGVLGVAFSTTFSHGIACLILFVQIRSFKGLNLPWRDIFVLRPSIFKKIIAIGAPIAGENLSYNIGQMVINWIISLFGTAMLSANTIASTLVRFVFIPAFSIGNAGQIKTGYLVGAGRFSEAKRGVWKYYALGLAFTLVVMGTVYFFRTPLLRLFSIDMETSGLVATLLLISFARETGRVSNIVVIPGLKGSGDVIFPVLIGVIFMWGIGVGGAWILGKTIGMGLVGVWIAISADEWLRGLIMLFRWQSDAWKNKSLIRK